MTGNVTACVKSVIKPRTPQKLKSVSVVVKILHDIVEKTKK